VVKLENDRRPPATVIIDEDGMTDEENGNRINANPTPVSSDHPKLPVLELTDDFELLK
jgi:hypothetical protein